MPEQLTSRSIVHRSSMEFVESTNVWEFMQAHGIDDYDTLIKRTTTDVDGVDASGLEWFWDELVDYLGIEFYEDYDAIRDDSRGPQFDEWYSGGSINVAHNTVDRHAAQDNERRNKVAVLWEGEDGVVQETTYHELARQSNQVANFLVDAGVERGDTVGLFMPMVPEVVSILYGCLKAGAIAVPIFSGFGVDAAATRIEDAACSVLFTGDGFLRRGSPVTLKGTADDAIAAADSEVTDVVVYERLGLDVPTTDGRDQSWEEAVGSRDDEFDTRALDSNDESLLLYSSGTTGQPKGIVHTHAGILMQCAKEVYFGFDLQPADRFFWVSNIGWMMGPWSLIGTHTFGGTVFIYEGAPDHPQPNRFWNMIDRHDITQFGVSPTAIRALREEGDEWIEGHDLSSLRLLGSTGEPWDPESWQWFYDQVGNGDTPIINISGGTEICGCFLMPMPINDLKPCTLGGPGLGMDVDIVDGNGESVREDNEQGYLVARDSCPSMTKSLWGGDERYLEEYWSTWEDIWNHGDWAQQDEDGFWFLHGRADDTLNVAGRKVGPAEIESVAIEHEDIAQAVTVGVPDDTTGTAVVLFAIADDGRDADEHLATEVREIVGEEHGKPFLPREVNFVDEFPKTQSGKIVRRVIEVAYTGDDLGDLSSIDNPEVLDDFERAG